VLPSLPAARARFGGRLAIACIGSSLLIMIAVPAAGPSRAVVTMPAPGWGPPWWIPLHLPPAVVTVALWVAVITGAAGVTAGLVAIHRGARPPARLLVGVALAVTAVLAVLPPAGSTDALDYAAYGRMVAIGHDPYVMTPLQLRRTGDPVGLASPLPWQTKRSVYGPLATVEQATAAILGGTSAARITFWLKLWNALAFGVIVLALDRLVRDDPARRARAHLLWSVNPLLLWVLVAGGHIDALAAGVGFLGLALMSPAAVGHPGRGEPGRHPGVLPGLAAGALVGAAADLKITFILFGLGIAWAARRSPRTLLAAAGGGAVVLVPSYLWFGPPAVAVLVYRDASATGDNLYQLFFRPFGLTTLPGLTLIAASVLVAVTWLLMRRLPEGFAARPAVRPAFALSLAWLLVWPYQRPWYDAMVFCLLALYPASRLDWPLLGRLAAVTIYSMPGMPGRPHLAWLAVVTRTDQILMVPLVRFAALIAVIVLCLSGAWRMGRAAADRDLLPPGPLLIR
jgi:alpha-1,6-mannosyltransferase